MSPDGVMRACGMRHVRLNAEAGARNEQTRLRALLAIGIAKGYAMHRLHADLRLVRQMFNQFDKL